MVGFVVNCIMDSNRLQALCYRLSRLKTLPRLGVHKLSYVPGVLSSSLPDFLLEVLICVVPAPSCAQDAQAWQEYCWRHAQQMPTAVQ